MIRQAIAGLSLIIAQASAAQAQTQADATA